MPTVPVPPCPAACEELCLSAAGSLVHPWKPCTSMEALYIHGIGAGSESSHSPGWAGAIKGKAGSNLQPCTALDRTEPDGPWAVQLSVLSTGLWICSCTSQSQRLPCPPCPGVPCSGTGWGVGPGSAPWAGARVFLPLCSHRQVGAMAKPHPAGREHSLSCHRL